MDVKEAVEKRRSIRKFLPETLPSGLLLELVRLGRLYASAMNAQPVRFAIVTEREGREKVFSALKWAMRLDPYRIREDERPMAYILLLGKEEESAFFEFDAGCAATTIMLAATGSGVASCCLKVPSKESLAAKFDFQGYVPYYAIALGVGKVRSRSVDAEDSLGYWVDEYGDFSVPKRKVEDVLLACDLPCDL